MERQAQESSIWISDCVAPDERRSLPGQQKYTSKHEQSTTGGPGGPHTCTCHERALLPVACEIACSWKERARSGYFLPERSGQCRYVEKAILWPGTRAPAEDPGPEPCFTDRLANHGQPDSRQALLPLGVWWPAEASRNVSRASASDLPAPGAKTGILVISAQKKVFLERHRQETPAWSGH